MGKTWKIIVEIMWTDAGDAIRYIENNLKISLNIEFDVVSENYNIVAKLILNNKVISEDSVKLQSI